MYNRHTNLFISVAGRERILRETQEQCLSKRDCRALLLPEQFSPAILRRDDVNCFTSIPGIVRREEGTMPCEMIPVGFSSWRFEDGGKIRLPAFVHTNEIENVVTPKQALDRLRCGNFQQRTRALCALAEIVQYEDKSLFSFGVWGSAAMELMTGYFYTHEDSDLDIILSLSKKFDSDKEVRELLQDCFNVVEHKESVFNTRIDVELSLPNGYGVSLKELFRDGHTVLAKGMTDVILISKSELFDEFVCHKPESK